MTTEAQVGPGQFEVPTRLAGPWPRLWARYLDIQLESLLLAFVVALLWPAFFEYEQFDGPSGSQVLGVVLLPFVLFLDALIVATFGNSPGKALVGIKVLDIRGQRPSFGSIVERNGGLWFAGLALGIGLIALVTMYRSRKALDRGQILRWDSSSVTRCFDLKVTDDRCLAAAVAFFLVSFGVVWLGIAFEHRASNPSSIAAGINAESPVFIDEETRLDGASAGPGKRVTIHFTLVNVSPAIHNMQYVEGLLDANIKHSTIKFACSPDGFRPFLDAQGVVDYQYSDRDGGRIKSFALALEDCADAP